MVCAPKRRLQLLRRAQRQHAPVVDDRQPVAELVGLFHVVRGQQHGDAFLAQPLHGRPHRHAALRIEPRAGLVEKQHGGPVRDGARNLHPLRQPAGQLRRIGILCARSAETASSSSSARALRLRVAEAEIAAMKIEVLIHGQRAVQRVELRHHADVPPRVRRMLHHVDARRSAPCRWWAARAWWQSRWWSSCPRRSAPADRRSRPASTPGRRRPRPPRAASTRRFSSALQFRRSRFTRAGKGMDTPSKPHPKPFQPTGSPIAASKSQTHDLSRGKISSRQFGVKRNPETSRFQRCKSISPCDSCG